MMERRALSRIPMNRAALLSFDGIRGTHPCVVRDISALGACISARYFIFADEFVLSFDGHPAIFICRIVWRKETLCGAAFLLRRRSPKLANDSGEYTKVVRLDRQTMRRERRH